VVSAKVLIPQVQSLARERVDALLARIWQHRVGLVVAPAGSGKSTLLAGFAASANVPVAWYRAESWDAKTPTDGIRSRPRPARWNHGGDGAPS